jgi:3-hydroxyacyl-[acyl-carrier-protein] dehydratase
MSDIESLIPHRRPFLFVDRIESATKERIVAHRTFTLEENAFFEGHFPGYPIVPGVILIETMAQCGGAGVRMIDVLPDGALFFLATVDRVKFRRQVRPGDELRLEIENLRISPRAIRQRGKAFVGSEEAVEAEWMCMVSGEGALR